jgi:UDPglucose 6-dehydrogenase
MRQSLNINRRSTWLRRTLSDITQKFACEEEVARITIVGTGYVGLTTGASFAEMGHDVRCIDIDSEKIRGLNHGRLPIFERGLGDMIDHNQTLGRLIFTTDFDLGLKDADFIFIAVGTPQLADSSSVDMRFVFKAARDIAEHACAPAIVVNKSTSPIGTVREICNLLTSHRPELGPWRVVSNPEFLREGSAIDDCMRPARIVLGCDDHHAAAAVGSLYETLHSPVIITDTNSAEMIKYASNAFLATKISFINEVARICHALDADVATVAEGMGLDPRIGREFLQAGLGYGGSCFPKDVAALTDMADRSGLHPQLLTAVTQINEDQRHWVAEILETALGGISARSIAVWGIAFKPCTDDTRKSAAIALADHLHTCGAAVTMFDPVVVEPPAFAEAASTKLDAVAGADALIVATEWEEFVTTEWAEVRRRMRGDLVFDTRNCLDPLLVQAAGLRYIGVGRKGAFSPAEDPVAV